ncbi:hypothetical protein KFL_001940110 [Klebsormidium nitens]|uniref:Uncharacterized protein n=1 Tax=Klebsormidium nitens TaxID=105231 RepID=A0A1Y1I0V7_KLENI|nr:hypothetical protein KFL_001940110 [Klebsormidium nitens]|eukprot:GAQ84554.1 hypothetical protein KFL_001940110 [Klebsormidium nitens]
MVSATTLNKAALGQGVAASGSTLGKSTFTGARISVPCVRSSRRSEGKVCMSASKDETNKVSAPLRKGLAAGLLAATLATSAGPAYADTIPVVEKRWGQIAQKVEKAGKQAKEFTPNLDALNKKNALAEATAGKIPQRSAPKFGAKSLSEGFKRQNVSFTEAPPLTYVVDTKGTPADPATIKDDAVGGVTDPASIPGRIKDRADTIASKIGQLTPNLNADKVIPGDKGVKDIIPDLVEGSSEKIQQRSAPSYGTGKRDGQNVNFSAAPQLTYVVDTKGTPADPETVKDDAIGGVKDPASIPGRIKERAGTIASKIGELTPDLNADKVIPGDKGVKDVIPDLVEGSSEKIQQRSAPSYGTGKRDGQNVSFSAAPQLTYVVDTKGTPADPETVKDDAIGGVKDPASIPGRIKERAGTIASKIGQVLPDLPTGASADQEVGRNDRGVQNVAPRQSEGSSSVTVGPRAGTDPKGGSTGVSMTSAPSLTFVGLDTKGTPADPATVKDDVVGGVTDPASIPGRVKERADTIASKIGNLKPELPNADKAIPGDKGVKDLAPDLVEGSSEKIPQKKGGYASGTGVSMTSAPSLTFVGLDTKGTPADPETVKEDVVGGVTDPASIPGRIKERADTIASKIGNLKPDLPNLPNADQAIPGDKGVKDLAPDLVEGSSEKIPQRKGGYASGTGVSMTESAPLMFVGLDTKGTPADPATVKDDAIGGVTDPASIPGRIKERAGTIASKLPDLPNIDQALPGGKGLKDVAPDVVEGSSQKIQQRRAPGLGNYGGDGFSRSNVSLDAAPALQFVGLDTKGTPADPETVKDDVVGGVTDPASIPGRVKERAGTIASKLPSPPSASKILPSDKGLKDVAPDVVEGSSQKIRQRGAPGLGNYGADGFSRKNVSLDSAPALQFVGVDTKGTPADPETVKDDLVGGVTDPASIPGRIKERAGTIASKLPDLPNADKVIPGDKGVKDIIPDLVEGSSEKIQQRSAPSYGSQGAETNRTNVSFSSAPVVQFVGVDTKGTPADPATVKDDLVGGITDPASIPGRIKERAETIASKLPSPPKADQLIPGNKGAKDIAPDLVEGSSEKISQRSAGQ